MKVETTLETERLRIGDDAGGLAAGGVQTTLETLWLGSGDDTGDLLVAGD